MNFPFEMQPDRAAVSNRRAAQRGESIFRAFKKGFDPLTARFVFIRHAMSPGPALDARPVFRSRRA